MAWAPVFILKQIFLVFQLVLHSSSVQYQSGDITVVAMGSETEFHLARSLLGCCTGVPPIVNHTTGSELSPLSPARPGTSLNLMAYIPRRNKGGRGVALSPTSPYSCGVRAVG